MIENIDLRKKERENLLYRVYVSEKSISLTWTGQVSNSW